MVFLDLPEPQDRESDPQPEPIDFVDYAWPLQ